MKISSLGEFMDNFRYSNELTQTVVLTASGYVHEGEVNLDDLKRSVLVMCDPPESNAAGVRDGGIWVLSDNQIGVRQFLNPDLSQ